MKRIAVVLALMGLLVTVSSVRADDVYPSPFRGEPGSTFQEWTFPSFFAGAPDRVSNPYGRPGMRPSTGRDGTREWRAAYQGRTGVWQLTGDAALSFTVPNTKQDRKLKTIVIQVTYYGVFGKPRIEAAPAGWDPPTQPSYAPEVTDLGGGWFLLAQLLIRGGEDGGCPESEVITIRPPAAGSRKAYIDQVVIDTVCWG